MGLLPVVGEVHLIDPSLAGEILHLDWSISLPTSCQNKTRVREVANQDAHSTTMRLAYERSITVNETAHMGTMTATTTNKKRRKDYH